jgi:hypothetical protein
MCRAFRNFIWVPQWLQRPGGSADATIRAVQQAGHPNIPGARAPLKAPPSLALRRASLVRSGWTIIVMNASSSRFIEDDAFYADIFSGALSGNCLYFPGCFPEETGFRTDPWNGRE